MCFADTDLESGRSVVSTGVASGHLSLTSADSLLRRFSSRSCPDHTRIYNREKVGSYPESFYCLIILCSLTVKQIFSPITLIGDRAFSSILFRSRDINQHKGFSTPILLVKILSPSGFPTWSVVRPQTLASEDRFRAIRAMKRGQLNN